MSLSEQFIQLYIVDYHVVERALKERYLIGQSVRAVIFVDIVGMRSEGPTPKVFQVSHLQRSFNHTSIE